VKEHCWCRMHNGKVGKRLELENAPYVRSGIPICTYECAQEYDRRKRERAKQLARDMSLQVNGRKL